MWVTNKLTITSVLNAGGYKEHLNNLEPDQLSGLQNKMYLLTPVGLQLGELTSNSLRESDLINLRVVYFNADTAKRDSNFDAFRSVLESLSVLSKFAGFQGDADFSQLEGDPNKSVGSVNFYFGFKEC